MKPYRMVARFVTCSCLVLFAYLSTSSLPASGQATPQITRPVSETELVQLKGNVRPEIQGAKDLGTAEPSLPAGRILLVLQRSSAQEAELQSFLQQAHEQASPKFHHWLTPEAFGQRFGVADADLQQVRGWLQSHGLAVAKTTKGKLAIEFSGTIGQVNEAFHTSIHQYSVKGVTHYSNATNPKIPAALSAVVAGAQLNDFRPVAQNKVLGHASFDPKTHKGTPQWTYPNGQGNPDFYFLTPEDFATQYDVKPVYAAGVNGAGETIGIINDSNIDISLVNAYRKLFGLPYNPPQVVIDGTDPGVNGDSVEAYLDVENAGAVAPNAKITLYIGSQYGLLGDGGLNFAIIRAIDDAAAPVLSLSFASCEEAPTAVNQFINAAWEEAAAQGQTVLVSSGDTGSASQCTAGVGVSGLASTPWNIAVGGSDFYFSDYASGGASIANYWSATNDTNLGSLQKTMVEQVWNGTPYSFNSTTYDPVDSQLYNDGAGGGGASRCAVSVSDSDGNVTSCVSGYPKPSWQTGLGVPNDQVRDLPDLSLFASAGNNGVAWPLCAFPGDCTETSSDGSISVLGVGGTSASAPAMAGVMALINQKYGPQGQANYTFYPLAAQFSSTIHPIDLGSNNEPCYPDPSEPACIPDTNGDGFGSLGVYSATPGYDQASGLGSVDVAQLINNWSEISFKPSATTLALSPTSITHGQDVTANIAVTGTGTPAGAVSLVSTSTLTAYHGIEALELDNGGTASGALNYLPGGTYQVVAEYSGDGTNGASKSSPVTLTVSPEDSVANMAGVYFDLVNYDNASLPQNGTIPYGTDILFDTQIVGASVPAASESGSDGHATGQVTYTDGATVLATVPLGSAGVAEFTGSQLGVGAHTVTASYSGDASFHPSTSKPLAFTIAKDTTYAFFTADNTGTYNPDGNLGYVAGQTLQFEAIVQAATGGYGNTPTGSVTVQIGNNAPTVLPLAFQDLLFYGNVGEAPITLPNIQAGTYTLTISYSGDANFQGSSSSEVLEVAAPVLLPSTTVVIQTSPASGKVVAEGQFITFQVTVAGSGNAAPTGQVAVYLANTFGYYPATMLIPGSGSSSTATITLRAENFAFGQNPLTINYSGDAVYGASTSNVIDLVVDGGDFLMASRSTNLAIPSGSSGTATLDLSPLNNFTGAVALSCAAPAGLTCTLNPSSVALSSAATATVTIGTTISNSAAVNHSQRWLKVVGAPLLACMIFCVVPRRRRFGWILPGLLAVSLFSGLMGCGGGATTSTPTQPTLSDAKPGNYTVTVSGMSSEGTIHSASINVTVQ